MSVLGAGSGTPKVVFGRGGAGNVKAKDSHSPEVRPNQVTPNLKSKMYTTGRGGTGNMAKNDYGEEAREAQDVDVPALKLAEGQQHTGRGGAANTYRPSGSEIKEAAVHNEKVRKESFNRKRSKDGRLTGLVEKGKEVLKG